ncbi:MAG TPA: hypothetical protein VFQ00_04825 [Terriglobales bacterium]|nr:hypothetical protein [Terriglobales bacterium]
MPSGVDIIVGFTLMPLLLVVWLPSRWVPWGKIPKTVLGPYVVYAAAALWYFKLDAWLVAVVLVVGTVLCILAIKEKFATQ